MKEFILKLVYARKIVQKRIKVQAIDKTHAYPKVEKYVKDNYPKVKSFKIFE